MEMALFCVIIFLLANKVTMVVMVVVVVVRVK